MDGGFSVESLIRNFAIESPQTLSSNRCCNSRKEGWKRTVSSFGQPRDRYTLLPYNFQKQENRPAS
jgi:hypothetical protein